MGTCKYVLTAFARDDQHSCIMDGKELGRWNSRDAAERWRDRINGRMLYHVVELTAIVEEGEA